MIAVAAMPGLGGPSRGQWIAVTALRRQDVHSHGGDDWGCRPPFPWTAPGVGAMIAVMASARLDGLRAGDDRRAASFPLDGLSRDKVGTPMNATLQAALSTAILFAMVGLVVAQDGEPSTCPRELLAAWIKVLKDPGDRERAHKEAYSTLGPNGPFGKIAVPALIDAMEEKDADIRADVVATLLQYGPAVVPDLVRALKRPKALVRQAAAEALQHASPDPKIAFPALLDAMRDKAAEVRSAATLGVVTHGRRSDKTVPALAAALKDSDAAVRTTAANSLWRLCVFARFGRKAEPAIPALIVALNDKERLVRLETIATITALGALAHAAVPALIDAYEHESKNEDRVVILQALGAIGPGAKEAVPALREILQQSSDPELAREAISALGGIGPNGKAAVPDLLTLLQKSTDASFGRHGNRCARGHRS